VVEEEEDMVVEEMAAIRMVEEVDRVADRVAARDGVKRPLP
jgi:hypothetical protein